MNQHSPKPWHNKNGALYAADGSCVSQFSLSQDDIAMIVKAVNNFDELVEILEQVKDIIFYNETIEKMHGMTDGHNKIADRIRTILAKVKS
jgi:hypothetical protein